MLRLECCERGMPSIGCGCCLPVVYWWGVCSGGCEGWSALGVLLAGWFFYGLCDVLRLHFSVIRLFWRMGIMPRLGCHGRGSSSRGCEGCFAGGVLVGRVFWRM